MPAASVARPTRQAPSRGSLGASVSPSATAAEANDRLDLFDEHTFGYWDTARAHPQTQTIELLKASLAHEGHELASFELMHALEGLADNVSADRDVGAVLLCNPADDDRAITPRVPSAWIAPHETARRTYRASRFAYDGRAWETGFTGDDGHVFAPVTIPGRSWVVEPIENLVPFEPRLLRHRHRRRPAVRARHTTCSSRSRRITGHASAASRRRRLVFATTRTLDDCCRSSIGAGSESCSPHDRGIICSASSASAATNSPNTDGMRTTCATSSGNNAISACWRSWEPVREFATRVSSCTDRRAGGIE